MKPPPRRRGRTWPRLALVVLLLLGVLGAGHALLWRMMADRLESGLATWVAVRRAAGWRVEHAPPLRGGWPLAATLTLRDLRVEGGGATLPGGMALAAEGVVLRVAPPRLDRLAVDFTGPGRLRLGGAEVPFAADTLRAILPLEGGTPPGSAEVVAARLRIGLPVGPLELRAGRLTLESLASATEGEPALSVLMAAEGVELPVAPAGVGLGRRIDSFEGEFTLTGPVPPGRRPAARAAAWRDGGGAAELRSLDLRWGPVAGSAAATLALDGALQPMGAGTLRVSGAREALDALTGAGLVERRAAAAARTLLPLLTRTNEETGAREVELPLTLEDRTLAVARIPVMRLPEWRWP